MVTNRPLGIFLVLASAFFFSLAGVFAKLVTVGPWTIAGWRGLVGALLIGLYAWWRKRARGERFTPWLDQKGWMIAAISLLSAISFIGALKHTFVANVAVIYAITPFAAAALAWLVLREPVRRLTIVTTFVSLAGVVIVVSGGLGTGNALGNALALVMTLTFAIYMVAVRAFAETPVLWAVAVGAFALFLVSFVADDPLVISARDFGVCMLFGLCFTIAVVLLTEGARFLPVAETGLICNMDVPFAAGAAWLVISEVPPSATIIGGSVVILAIVLQALGDLGGARWLSWRNPRGRDSEASEIASNACDLGHTAKRVGAPHEASHAP